MSNLPRLTKILNDPKLNYRMAPTQIDWKIGEQMLEKYSSLERFLYEQ